MGTICAAWAGIVGLALLGRALWKAMQHIADWKPRPRYTPPPVPPPVVEPTPAERAAAAKEQYEATLAMLEAAGLDEIELHAGKLKAKQTYLKDLDGML